MNHGKKIHLAYVTSMFPCLSETFVLNELVQHKKAGLKIKILSLKKLNEEIVHPLAYPFISETCYPEVIFSPKLLWSHLKLLVSNPVTYTKIVIALLRMPSSSVETIVKSLAVFLLSPTFLEFIKENSINCLHAHFATYPALLAWILSRFTGIPFSFTAHAHDIYVNSDLLKFVGKDADRIITISRFNKRLIQTLLKNKQKNEINVIHCGIDIAYYKYKEKHLDSNSASNGCLNVLSVGRLTGIKGFKYLIEACYMLHKEGISFKCNIIGDGPLARDLKELVKKLNLTERIYFLGPKTNNEVMEYLNKADVFVLACAKDKKEGHDGIPVVFMEAMASGTPVIGTFLGGIPELIQHGITGLCAMPEDPHSLKETIKFFINHPEKVKIMEKKARDLITREFNIAKNAKHLRKIFNEMVEDGGKGQ